MALTPPLKDRLKPPCTTNQLTINKLHNSASLTPSLTLNVAPLSWTRPDRAGPKYPLRGRRSRGFEPILPGDKTKRARHISLTLHVAPQSWRRPDRAGPKYPLRGRRSRGFEPILPGDKTKRARHISLTLHVAPSRIELLSKV